MTIAALQHQVDAMAGALAAPLRDIAQAGSHLRGSTAATLEAAIAGAAATAVAARLQAELALAPRLPGATGLDVAASITALQTELMQTVPLMVAAQVLGGDPRALPVLLGLLAQDGDLDEVASATANGGNGGNGLLTVAQEFARRLQDAQGQGTGAVAAWLSDLAHHTAPEEQGTLSGAALRVLSHSVQRVQRAAQQGAASVFSRAQALAVQLQAGKLARVFPGRDTGAISLDREYSGVVPGSYLLLERQSYRELYTVQAAGSTSRSEFAVQAKSATLALAGQGLAGFAQQVRQTAVHLRSEALARARTPIEADVSGDRLAVMVDVADMADVAGLAAGRRLLIRGLRRDNGQALVHAATLVSATPAANTADGVALVFTPPLPAALLRSSVVVHGNVAQASHGQTVTQVLGSGDASRAHQRFDLQHAPLTHRAAASESGARAELVLRVGGVQWQERATLFGAAASERVYTLSTDEHGRTWIQFGDGTRGARPPSAGNNLRATYRKGLGSAGNVRAEALSQALSRPLGFKGVSNPAPARGGTDAEDSASARRSLPLGTRTLGRVVSVLDYEDFARAYAGIAKAQARVLRLTHGPVVAITLAAAGGAAIDSSNPLWLNLLAALKASGDPHVQLRLLSVQQRHYRLGLKVRCDAAFDSAAVLAAVLAALRAHGAFDARALGQPVHGSELIATAHGVPGVVAVDLDFLHWAGSAASLRPTLRAADTRIVAGAAGGLAAAELLTLDPGPLSRLEVMP